MNISEDTFAFWAKGPSATEAEKCENAETAVGKFPVEALHMIRRIAEQTEPLIHRHGGAVNAEVMAAKKLLDGAPTPDELRMMQGRVESVAQKIGEALYSQGGEGGAGKDEGS